MKKSKPTKKVKASSGPRINQAAVKSMCQIESEINELKARYRKLTYTAFPTGAMVKIWERGGIVNGLILAHDGFGKQVQVKLDGYARPWFTVEHLLTYNRKSGKSKKA